MKVNILFLTLFVAAAVPIQPVGAAVATGSCVNYEDDWGWGGSDVDCSLGCQKNAGLLVAGFAQDVDASVSAKYNCGKQAAGCSVPAPACAGVAPGLTSEAQAEATCSAESDELWSSTIYVACATVGGLPGNDDPMRGICAIVGDVFPPCKNTGTGIGKIIQTCLPLLENLLGTVNTTVLFPTSFSGHQINSMKALAYFPNHEVLTLTWGTSGESMCTASLQQA